MRREVHDDPYHRCPRPAYGLYIAHAVFRYRTVIFGWTHTPNFERLFPEALINITDSWVSDLPAMRAAVEDYLGTPVAYEPPF